MSQTVFHFRHFTIHQERCAMKVGTDGVLLGAWTSPKDAKRILDIGTGTGLLALMLAQKSDALIDAIDIDENSCMQAEENICASKWFDRVRVHHCSLQLYILSSATKYDLIVSNPPYFIDAYKAHDSSRNLARQADTALSFGELILGVKASLKEDGRFCVILPCKEGSYFKGKAAIAGLYCNRLTHVKTRSDRHEKRVMMEFAFHKDILVENELIIHGEELKFTEHYKNLTRDFYPAFNQ
jgi:tRNA1Val (adenine37-N6)-methyltransferase